MNSMPFGLAVGDLLFRDRPGGVGDVGLAVAELGEAVTGAGPFDGDRDAGLASANALPAAIEIGSTVDEPDTKMLPETSPPSSGASVVSPVVGGLGHIVG
jgi:hypothetical protein